MPSTQSETPGSAASAWLAKRESHETFSALPHSVKHCSKVEDECSARCNKRAPRLECHRHNAYVIAPRSASVARRTERASHPALSQPCRGMGSASRGFGLGARHYKERLLATVLSTPSPLHSVRRNNGDLRSSTPTSRRDIKTDKQRGDRAYTPSSKRRGAIQQILSSRIAPLRFELGVHALSPLCLSVLIFRREVGVLLLRSP